MRTTVDIDDQLLAEAKAVAVRQRRSVRSLIEEGLRWAIRPPRKTETIFELPVSQAGGELREGVDYSKHSALIDLMESDDSGRNG